MFYRSLTISSLLLIGAAVIPASAAQQMGPQRSIKPAPKPSPEVLVNVITDCFVPLKKMADEGLITLDQSIASTGIPGCQRPGAEDTSVGQMIDEFYVPRQVGVSP